MERSSRATTRVAPTMPRGKRLSRPVHSRGDPRGRPAGGWESPLNRIRQQSLVRAGVVWSGVGTLAVALGGYDVSRDEEVRSFQDHATSLAVALGGCNVSG